MNIDVDRAIASILGHEPSPTAADYVFDMDNPQHRHDADMALTRVEQVLSAMTMPLHHVHGAQDVAGRVAADGSVPDEVRTVAREDWLTLGAILFLRETRGIEARAV